MIFKIIFLAAFLIFLSTTAMAEAVSGYEFLSADTQAMQDDDFENPGYITVEQGQALFNEHRADEEQACSACHGEDGADLKAGKIAQYPIHNKNLGGLVTLQDQIHHCWEINLDRFPRDYDDAEVLALETFVRSLAQGIAVNVQIDGDMAPLLEKAETLYKTRYGQIDMSCYHCHVQHQGQMLRGQKLSQGQANGFPEYRLGKGRLTSLHQRLRECFISFRADPFEAGSEEFKLLELYLMMRGNGLKIETPAIRF